MNTILNISILEYKCGGENVLRTIKFILQLLNTLYIVIPIGLILMIIIDFAKSVVSLNEEDMKKNLSLSVKRIIFTMALFLIKPIALWSQELLGDAGVNIAECINIARSDDNLEKYNYSIVKYDEYVPETVEINTKKYTPGKSSKKNNITVDDFIESLENMSKQVEAENGKWTYTKKGQKESLTFEEAKKNNKKYTTCAKLVSWALRDIGVYSTDDPKYSDTRFFKCYEFCNYKNTVYKGGNVDKMIKPYLEKVDFSSSEMNVKNLIKQNKLKKGDIILWYDHQHTSVYAGDGVWYDAGCRGGDHGYYDNNGTYHFKTFKTKSIAYPRIWAVYRWK